MVTGSLKDDYHSYGCLSFPLSALLLLLLRIGIGALSIMHSSSSSEGDLFTTRIGYCLHPFFGLHPFEP